MTGHAGDKCELHTEQMVSSSGCGCHCFARKPVPLGLRPQIIYVASITGAAVSAKRPFSLVTAPLIVTKWG